MQALFINAAARTVTAFDFSGNPGDLADILHVEHRQSEMTGLGIEDSKTSDVLFVATNVGPDHGIFMISGIPFPLFGNAVLAGMVESERVSFSQSAGEAKDTNKNLEWLQSNVMWMEKMESRDSVAAFSVAKDNKPEAVLNVLNSMKNGGNCKVSGGDLDEVMQMIRAKGDDAFKSKQDTPFVPARPISRLN